MFTEPTPEHAWLQRMVGTWSFRHEWEMEPGGEKGESTGVEVVRPFGSLWIVSEGEGECPDGSSMRSMMTLGYDPARGRFPGSFFATPMAWMFVYDGHKEGERLTLETEGPGMADAAKVVRYRDVIEIESDSLRRMTSHAERDDGTWFEFMRAEFRRTE